MPQRLHYPGAHGKFHGTCLRPAASNVNPFGDVDNNQHLAAIQALAAVGITTGCGDTNYCPDEPVTRIQMASFLIRATDWLAEQAA